MRIRETVTENKKSLNTAVFANRKDRGKTMEKYLGGIYDCAVIGGGHAGIEASLACARLGLKTVMFTINLDAVGNMLQSVDRRNGERTSCPRNRRARRSDGESGGSGFSPKPYAEPRQGSRRSFSAGTGVQGALSRFNV